MKKGLIVLLCVVVVLAVFMLLLPNILTAMGFHAPYEDVKEYDLSGKKALIITTSTDALGEDGKATGVYASEMTVPYYQFLDAGIMVDVASIDGGEIPVEPNSLRYPLATEYDKRYLDDDELWIR